LGIAQKIEEVSMGKPLLTDEMIERANRGEKISGPPLLDDEETKILPTSSSRFGYANPKGHGFSQETLKILFAVIVLLILLVLAMKLL